MNIDTALSLLKEGRLGLLWKVTRLFEPFYRLTFVASAASCGLLGLLSAGPRPFDALASELSPEPSTDGALRAWLDVGCALGELALGPSGYRLEGCLSRALAGGRNDDVAALVEEVISLHHRLLVETPRRLKQRRLFGPDEHDDCLIARSSSIMEPWLFRIIDRALPPSGPARLLEVGCGAGTYMRHAAERNPELRAVGIERDPAVAAAARAAVQRTDLTQRIRIETCDIRERPSDASFDFVTLHNAIYYFPQAERVALLEKLSSFAKPGGRVLVSTSCRDGSLGMRLLHLWTSSTAGFGPLPAPAEIMAQMREAGLVDVEAKRVIPGEEHYVFQGSATASPR